MVNYFILKQERVYMKKLFIRDIPILSLLLIILQFNINTEYFIQKYPTASWNSYYVETQDRTTPDPTCSNPTLSTLPNGDIDWNREIDCAITGGMRTAQVQVTRTELVEASGNDWTDNCSDAQIFNDYKNYKCSDHYKINNFLPFIILILLFSTLIYLLYFKFKDTL